jgi:hypothetical protein
MNQQQYCTKGKELLLDLKVKNVFTVATRYETTNLDFRDRNGFLLLMTKEFVPLFLKLINLKTNSTIFLVMAMYRTNINPKQRTFCLVCNETIIICIGNCYIPDLVLADTLFTSYNRHRIEKIRALRWELGPVLPTYINEEKISFKEKDYHSKYNDILSEYNQNFGCDVTGDIEVSSSLFIFLLFFSSLSITSAAKRPSD